MSDPAILAAHEGPLRSRVGGAFPGQRAVFRGHDLHRDLSDARWIELYMLGISGKRVTSSQLRLLDAIWTYTSYPDARLWNNRVAALAGATRSTGALGVAAAMAVSEAGIFGGQIIMAIAGFLAQANQSLHAGVALSDIVAVELKTNRGIPGYGRPVRRMDIDERIGPILKLAEHEGLAQGPHLKIALGVEEILLSGRWRMRANYAAISAALVLDMGFSARDYYQFTIPAFLGGMPPCYLDALDRPEGSTFALRCERIEYDGPGRRSWGA